jgi:hypothetical protein
MAAASTPAAQSIRAMVRSAASAGPAPPATPSHARHTSPRGHGHGKHAVRNPHLHQVERGKRHEAAAQHHRPHDIRHGGASRRGPHAGHPAAHKRPRLRPQRKRPRERHATRAARDGRRRPASASRPRASHAARSAHVPTSAPAAAPASAHAAHAPSPKRTFGLPPPGVPILRALARHAMHAKRLNPCYTRPARKTSAIQSQKPRRSRS